MKKAYWFRHDTNAHSDGKLVELKAEFGIAGVGMYWELLESLHNNDGYLSRPAVLMLCRGNAIADAFVDRCLELELLHDANAKLFSKRLLEELTNREEKSRKMRANAVKKWRKDAKKRGYAIASAKAHAVAMRGEERRRDKTIDTPNVSTVHSESHKLSSTKKGPRPSVEKLMKAMYECFGTLDRTDAENRRYSWLLIQRAMKGPPEASEDRAADLCCALITAARKSDWWGDHITCVQDIYRNARKIAASLREQESAKAVFIS